MDAGAAKAIRMEPADSIVPVVFVPGKPVLTETARGLLPRTVPHVDAAANAGRAALLVEAMTRRPELLLPATQDRLHQEYRSPAMPESAALVERLRADGIPAVISGAGPTVLALADRNTADKVERSAGDDWAANRLSLDDRGASVLPLATTNVPTATSVGTAEKTAGPGDFAGDE
jgi:homoserine kinase